MKCGNKLGKGLCGSLLSDKGRGMEGSLGSLTEQEFTTDTKTSCEDSSLPPLIDDSNAV